MELFENLIYTQKSFITAVLIAVILPGSIDRQNKVQKFAVGGWSTVVEHSPRQLKVYLER
jgi:hypothetical protein